MADIQRDLYHTLLQQSSITCVCVAHEVSTMFSFCLFSEFPKLKLQIGLVKKPYLSLPATYSDLSNSHTIPLFLV